jgi:hypothetical protein
LGVKSLKEITFGSKRTKKAEKLWSRKSGGLAFMETYTDKFAHYFVLPSNKNKLRGP